GRPQWSGAGSVSQSNDRRAARWVHSRGVSARWRYAIRRSPTLIELQLAYLIVTGTTTAPRAAELVQGLLRLVPQVITIATPHAARVVAPRDLSSLPGNRLVESYFDEAILP